MLYPFFSLTALGVYFGFDAIRFSKLIADWSFKDMNPDLTPLIVIVSREKKGYNTPRAVIR
jgi:hypothetical protein